MTRLIRVLGIILATMSLTMTAATVHAKKAPQDKEAKYAGKNSDSGKCWPEVGVVFEDETYSVDVESTKALSNIVLLFADGTTERFEDLSDHEGSFAGTGENGGKILTGVWVKSGCNHSGDGPGYGEFFENTDNVTNLPVISIGDAPGIMEPGLSAEMVEVLFEVSLSEMVPLDGEPVVVQYATRDGTATAGMDYIPVEGVLVFEAGEISKTISVLVFDDFEEEAHEELFYVDLIDPRNALSGQLTGTGTILDDDTDF